MSDPVKLAEHRAYMQIYRHHADFLDTYIALMCELYDLGAQAKQVTEIIEHWAEMHKERVASIYPEYKAIKAAEPSDDERTTPAESQRQFEQLVIYRLIDAYRRKQKSEASTDWIMIVVGCIGLSILASVLPWILRKEGWVSVLWLLLLIVPLTFCSVSVFVAQFSVLKKLEVAWRWLSRAKREDKRGGK